MNADVLKQQAAEYAVQFIQSGMIVGLGTGSTAIFAVQLIAQKIHHNDLKDILAIPTSLVTETEAYKLGIPLTTLDEHRNIDVTIDGADEVDPNFNLIKGGGGALLREKIVAQATRREIIVIDESKLSHQLGTRWAVPVEVIPFGWRSQSDFIEALGATVKLRQGNNMPYRTDQENYILDCEFAPIDDPTQLAQTLIVRSGIVEHGLFINCTRDVIVAGTNGIQHLRKSD